MQKAKITTHASGTLVAGKRYSRDSLVLYINTVGMSKEREEGKVACSKWHLWHLTLKKVCQPCFRSSLYRARAPLHLLQRNVENTSAIMPTSRTLIPVGLDAILLVSP